MYFISAICVLNLGEGLNAKNLKNISLLKKKTFGGAKNDLEGLRPPKLCLCCTYLQMFGLTISLK